MTPQSISHDVVQHREQPIELELLPPGERHGVRDAEQAIGGEQMPGAHQLLRFAEETRDGDRGFEAGNAPGAHQSCPRARALRPHCRRAGKAPTHRVKRPLGRGNGNAGMLLRCMRASAEENHSRRGFKRAFGGAALLVLALTPAASSGAEPKGVRLRPTSFAVDSAGQPVSEPVLIPWGETLDVFKARWPGSTPASRPRCVPSLGSGRIPIVACREPENWVIDFGDDSFVPDLSLRFHDSKFYEFEVDMSADRGYSLAYAVMLKALGQPTKRTSEPKQNAYGATFEGNTVSWLLPHVSVVLRRRVFTIDDAELTVTYRPLAPSAKPKEWTAPF